MTFGFAHHQDLLKEHMVPWGVSDVVFGSLDFEKMK